MFKMYEVKCLLVCESLMQEFTFENEMLIIVCN